MTAIRQGELFADIADSGEEETNESSVRSIYSRFTGAAAQHIASASLWSNKYEANPAPEGCKYDVWFDIEGRPIKIQVKGSRINQDGTLKFGTGGSRRGDFSRGKRRACDDEREILSKNLSTYYEHYVDLFAFVCIDSRLVQYATCSSIKTKGIIIKPNQFSLEKEKMSLDYCIKEIMATKLTQVQNEGHSGLSTNGSAAFGYGFPIAPSQKDQALTSPVNLAPESPLWGTSKAVRE